MNCNDFEKNIDAFLRDSLEAEQLNSMREHSASCASCARLAQLYSIVTVSLNNAEPVKAPEGFTEKVLASVESEIPDSVEEFIPAEANLDSADRHVITSLDCRVFENHVAAYVEGLLENNLLGSMEDHRAACSSCESLVNIHKTVFSSLDTAEPVMAPEGLAGRILSAVEVESAENEKAFGVIKSYSRYWKLTTGLAAAGSLVAALIILVGNIFKSFFTTWKWFVDIEALWLNITVLPLILQAWIAEIMPAEQWVRINLLLEPIQFPYLPLSIPPYYFIAFIVLATSTWAFVKYSIYYGIPLKSPYNFRDL